MQTKVTGKFLSKQLLLFAFCIDSQRVETA